MKILKLYKILCFSSLLSSPWGLLQHMPLARKSHGSKRTIWEPNWSGETVEENGYLSSLENKALASKRGFRYRMEREKTRLPIRKRTVLPREDPEPPQWDLDGRLVVPVKDPVFKLLLRGLHNVTSEYGKRSTLSSQSKTSETGAFQLEDVQGHFNFTRVGGYEELKKELSQILELIRSPENYTQYGIRVPRGIMLEGPPGNGKTLIAKCLAGEAGMNFVSCAGAEFNEKYVGVGASRIRELFKFAEQNKPCIVFIDEMDALGRKRSGDGESAHAERDQTLNQLLVLMDGFSSTADIVVLSATNRVDILDPALLRPGRIDKIIHVPNPDTSTRKEILQIHTKQKPLNTTIEYLTKITNGLSGAQIENLLNEAVLFSIRNNSLPVTAQVLDVMKEKLLIGQTSGLKRNMSVTVLRRIAVHEIGHLLMALDSEHYDKPWKVTIDSMNPKNSLGYTIFETDEADQGLFLREYFEDKIKVLLGGRVAEEVFYGNSISSGALSDLEAAFSMAKKMVMEYGMGTEIIYPYFSETYKKRIDEQIHSLLARAYRETKHYLEKNKMALSFFADVLLEKKTLHTQEIYDLYQEWFPSLPKTKTEVLKFNIEEDLP